MKCRHFQLKMNQLLDDRKTPGQDTALQKHAAHCPACRQSLELFNALGQAWQHSSSFNVANRASTRTHGSWRITAMVVAASLSIGAVWLGLTPSHVPDTSSPRPPAKQARIEPFPFHGWLLGSRERLLSTYWWDRRVLQPVQAGFQPLASSFSSTINVLHRAWPAARSEIRDPRQRPTPTT